MIPRPAIGEICLLRADAGDVRTALRAVLSAWSHLNLDALPLRETSRGPVWVGLLDGATLDISISYADGQGWIALRRGGAVGIDVTRIESIPEAEEVARQFFGSQLLEKSRTPSSFARAWTELEARLKCGRRNLGDLTLAEARRDEGCRVQSFQPGPEQVLTVAARGDGIEIPPLTFAGDWTNLRESNMNELDPVVTLTENAAGEIKSKLATEADGANKGLRLYVEKGGCSGLQYGMVFDEKRPDDLEASFNGVKVWVDAFSAKYLRGSTVDFSDALSGGGFKITNPQAAQSCGCGKSFETLPEEKSGR